MEAGETDSFLNEIKKEVMEDKSQRKRKISWNNIQIKREIKLGFKQRQEGQKQEKVLIGTMFKEKIIQHLESKMHQGTTHVFSCNGQDKISPDSGTETNTIPLEDCQLEFNKVDSFII